MYSVVYVEKDNAATTGRSTIQGVTFVLPVVRDVNGVDELLNTTAGNDAITIVNGIGGTNVYTNTATVLTVDALVASINGSTIVPGLTLSADRDAFHEQIVTVAYTYSNGLAAAASATLVAGEDKIYFTYGTDPETGQAIGTQATVTANSASGAIAVDIATALNNATGAYVATGTADGKIRITAQVSNTTNEDRGPIPHAFQTLTVVPSSPSTTLLLAGQFAKHIIAVSAVSNTTAIASGLFYFSTPSVNYSGVRVTAQNPDKTVSLASIGITTGVTSSAFVGKGGGILPRENAQLLTAGTNMVAAAINSSALDYVANYAAVESTVSVASTAGTTDRTAWLSN
jgi:hypothetical protein